MKSGFLRGRRGPARVVKDLLPQVGQKPPKLGLGEVGFQQIVVGAQAEGLPHQLKFIVARQDHRHRHPGAGPQLFQQLQAAHARHLNVGDEQIHVLQAQIVQGLLAVEAVLHNPVAAALPVQQGGQGGTHQGVVIHDQGSYHGV